MTANSYGISCGDNENILKFIVTVANSSESTQNFGTGWTVWCELYLNKAVILEWKVEQGRGVHYHQRRSVIRALFFRADQPQDKACACLWNRLPRLGKLMPPTSLSLCQVSAKNSILHTRHFHQIHSQFSTRSKASMSVLLLFCFFYFPVIQNQSKCKFCLFLLHPSTRPYVLFIWFQSFFPPLPDLYCPILGTTISLVGSNHSLVKFPKQSPRPYLPSFMIHLEKQGWVAWAKASTTSQDSDYRSGIFTIWHGHYYSGSMSGLIPSPEKGYFIIE